MSDVIRDVESLPGVYAIMVENDTQPAAAVVNAALGLRNRGFALTDEERGTVERLGSATSPTRRPNPTWR